MVKISFFILLVLVVQFSCAQENKTTKPTSSSPNKKLNSKSESFTSKIGTPDQNAPNYRLAAVRSLSFVPSALILTEPGREGLFRLDESDNTSLDNGGTILVTKSKKRYKRVFDNEINVHWFGAKGNSQSDDKMAIQNTINYAKSLSESSGGTYRVTIVFPAGFYYLSSPIDITNSNGLWLRGSSGRYINTSFIGDTGGVMLDFSGSTMSGCEGFTFLSMNGHSNRSTIGVLFALTNKGGLNCSIKNCYFKLEDNPKANSGFGTIGILNIRSEEFSASDCVINTNTPIILSNKSDLSDTGTNLTIASTFAKISTGTGSMGVANLNGQMSLQSIEKRQPALVLNGTNTVNFIGYIGRVSQSLGVEKPAILCSQSTSNITINATIESYSQLLSVTTSLHHAALNIVSANVTEANTPLINVTGASLIDGLTAKIHLPVATERKNRYLIYHAPMNNGNEVIKTRMINSEFYCLDLINNQHAVTANLLRMAENVTFNTNEPFSKKGGSIIQNFTNKVSCGNVGSIKPATAIRFSQCDRTTIANNNSGFYTIQISGVIRAGGYKSGGSCTLRFVATATISQSQNGNKDSPAYTVSLLGKSQITQTYLDITNVQISLNFSDNVGSILITPTVVGNGTGETVTYQGTAEVLTDFLVNDTIIFK